MSAAPKFNVTYLNPLDGKRHVLVDDVTKAEADAVLAKCSNRKGAPEWYMPAARIEAIVTGTTLTDDKHADRIADGREMLDTRGDL